MATRAKVLALAAWAAMSSLACDTGGDAPCDSGFDADGFDEPDGDTVWVTEEGVETWVWDILGAEGRQYANAVAESVDGAVLLAGYAAGRDESGSGWAARVDGDGTLRWERLAGSWLGGIAPHPDGGAVVVGHESSPQPHGLVAHLDRDGRRGWQLEWDLGPERERVTDLRAIRATPEGTLLLAGTMIWPNTTALVRGWLAEMSAEGELLWQRVVIGAEVVGSTIRLARGGDLLVGYVGPEGEPWLVRASRDGVVLWARHVLTTRSAGTDEFEVFEASDRDIVVVASERADVLVLRFDADGRQLWQRRVDGGGSEYGTAGVALDDGAVILAGGSVGANAGLDLWLARMSQEGELEWQKSMVREGCEVARGAERTMAGGIVVATGGCEHAMVVGLDRGGRPGERCESFLPTAFEAAPSEVIIEEVDLVPVETHLEPVVADLAAATTASSLTVACERGRGADGGGG